MGKKLLKFTIPLLLLAGIIIYSLLQYQEHSPVSFEHILGTSEESITKAYMLDGNNGSYVETTDKGKIQELISLVKDKYYRKSYRQEDRGGYSYHYSLYSGEDMVLSIGGDGYTVSVNGTYYQLDKPIDVAALEQWFSSLPVIP